MPLGLGLCGSCCGGAVFGTVCGQVRGCNGVGVAGISVQLQTAGGVLVQATTTDGVGNYCFSYSATATYQIKAFAPGSPAGYTDGTAFAASYGAGPHTANINFGVATTHVCTPCCNFPVKKALNLGLASPFALAYAGLSGGNHTWNGTHTITGNTVFCTGGVAACGHAGSFQATFTLTCITASSLWQLSGTYSLYSCIPPASPVIDSCDPAKYGPIDLAAAGTGCGYQIDAFFGFSAPTISCAGPALLLDFTIPSTKAINIIGCPAGGVVTAPVAAEIAGARSVTE